VALNLPSARFLFLFHEASEPVILSAESAKDLLFSPKVGDNLH